MRCWNISNVLPPILTLEEPRRICSMPLGWGWGGRSWGGCLSNETNNYNSSTAFAVQKMLCCLTLKQKTYKGTNWGEPDLTVTKAVATLVWFCFLFRFLVVCPNSLEVSFPPSVQEYPGQNTLKDSCKMTLSPVEEIHATDTQVKKKTNKMPNSSSLLVSIKSNQTDLIPC